MNQLGVIHLELRSETYIYGQDTMKDGFSTMGEL